MVFTSFCWFFASQWNKKRSNQKTCFSGGKIYLEAILPLEAIDENPKMDGFFPKWPTPLPKEWFFTASVMLGFWVEKKSRWLLEDEVFPFQKRVWFLGFQPLNFQGCIQKSRDFYWCFFVHRFGQDLGCHQPYHPSELWRDCSCEIDLI